MTSNNKLGYYIHQVSEKNANLSYDNVLGVAIEKEFMPSVANLIGTDLTKYNVIRKNRFAFNPMHVGRDEKLPIAKYKDETPALVSPAYMMFELNNEDELLSDYLELIMKTPHFDHACWYHTDASVRGGLGWDDFSNLIIPVPPIEEQRKIVHDYKVITDRIELLKKINTNLEETLSSIFNNSFEAISFETKGNNTISDIVKFGNGYAFSSDDYLENGKYKIITIGNVCDGYVDTSKVNYLNEISDKIESQFLLNIGDIVISLTGNVGRTALIKENNLLLNQRVARIVPVKENYYSFAYAFFRQNKTKEYLEGISKGTAQLNLSPVELSKARINYSFDEIENFNIKTKPILFSIINNSKEIGLLESAKIVFLSSLTKEV